MRQKIVAIVTTSDDAHANYIAPHLEKVGARILRINGDMIPSAPCHLTFATTSPIIEELYGIDPLSVDVVWYRKVIFPERFDPTSQFLRQETDGFIGSLLMELEGARWVNHRFAIERSRPKLHQIKVAQRYGFRVPDSIVTNQIHVLREFLELHDHQVVAKPIQTQVIVTPESPLVLGTRRLSIEDLSSATQYFPCYAQERLIFKYEMRVIVFGNRMHGFAIERRVPADDLKQLPLKHVDHRVCEINSELSEKIKKYMHHFTLEFGAFDFGIVDDEEPYFLELNPNGQWLWLQFATQYNLEQHFIELLLS